MLLPNNDSISIRDWLLIQVLNIRGNTPGVLSSWWCLAISMAVVLLVMMISFIREIDSPSVMIARSVLMGGGCFVERRTRRRTLMYRCCCGAHRNK